MSKPLIAIPWKENKVALKIYEKFYVHRPMSSNMPENNVKNTDSLACLGFLSQFSKPNIICYVTMKESGRGIHGWLLVYFFLAVIVDLSAIVLLLKYNVSGLAKEQGMDLTLLVCACLMTAYTIHAFVNRKPSAPFMGKHHVIINAVPWLCVLIGAQNYLERIGFAPVWLIGMIMVLFLAFLIWWRYYFIRAKQVKSLIPPHERKVERWERMIVILLYVAIIVFMCLSRGFDEWWKTVLGALGILFLSPLDDITEDTGEKKEEDK